MSAALMVAGLVAAASAVASQPAQTPPVIRTYKTVGATELKLHVFAPSTSDPKPRPTIVLIHGGGWNVGSPEWAYSQARRYAAKGLTAVSIEYRLSDFKAITPLEAMADTRDAIRWIRTHARELQVDPDKIAVYGWSAGGHLGLSAMLFDDKPAGAPSAAANAFVLMSPAISVAGSGYFRSLLLGKADPAAVSPVEHVRPDMAPIFMANGDMDVVTPPGAARRFCEAVVQAKGRCEQHMYPGVGHLLTRRLDRESQEMGPFDPDPATIADMFAKADAFLATLGFL